MQVVALVPLRGGSKSIPKKNIRQLAGKPLCAWVLEAAVACPSIDSVFVSTDSSGIAEVVNNLGLPVAVINRPDEYATDTASTESVMQHFADNVAFEAVVTIQATSPLLTAEDLDNAITKFEAQHLSSMLSAVRTKRFFWRDDGTPLNYDPQYRPRRQEFKGTLMENGAFYITRREILNRLQCRLGGKIGLYEMPEASAVEIDEPEDWAQIERLVGSRAG